MCDVMCALGPATVNGTTIFAKNSDRTPGGGVVRAAPRGGHPHDLPHHRGIPPGDHRLRRVAPHLDVGVEHGVNTAAVAIGNETIFTTLDPRSFPPALVGMDLVRLGLERATTATTAVAVITDLLECYGQGGSGHRDAPRPYWSSFLVTDPDEAFVVETSGRQFAVEAVQATRAISNRTTIASFDALHRHPRQPVEHLVDPRWRASRAVLDRGPLSVADAQTHLRHHVGGEEGWTVCMHVDGVEATTAALVAELPGSPADSAAPVPPIARFLLGSPCRSLFVPVVVGWPLGAPPAWERFTALTNEHEPAVRELEAALEADLTVALDDRTVGFNATVWRRVDALLRGCGC